MKIGEVVTQYREIHGLSQREFARRCGLSSVIISFLERGQRTNGDTYMPKFDTIRKVARGMGTTAEVLMANCDDFALDISEGKEDSSVIEEFIKDISTQSPDENMLVQAYRLIPSEHRIEAMQAVLGIKMKYEK